MCMTISWFNLSLSPLGLYVWLFLDLILRDVYHVIPYTMFNAFWFRAHLPPIYSYIWFFLFIYKKKIRFADI